jgi:hypothetical protein
VEQPDGIEAYIEYSTDLFSDETIARMAAISEGYWKESRLIPTSVFPS